ncbi:TetR/AcrR family transcriptional regulator [Galbitalea sp. SE-J8]|uniref:TetR/AcrR family transcriptional regulator n=1 Tax=Galbitalea sp. SE-J8 TaxID=3054952 RepID=UPI00259D17F5|nr:TetR/AcrR family transcriptional regulator [Galbitalea sp. SE-J8]MDM4763864.1 TetR/AcrR family transcriptional regulator [Galbitalea sp. SE-J8]
MVDDTRRRTPRSEVRERLLAAAAALFAQRGIAGASLDDIAASAGFTKGAIYSNFATKSELIVALMDHLTTAQLDATEKLIAVGGRDEASMAQVIRTAYGPITPERRAGWALATELRLHTERHPEALPGFVRTRLAVHDQVRGWVQGYLALHPETRLALTPDEVASVCNAILAGLALDADVPGTPTAGDLIVKVLLAIRR